MKVALIGATGLVGTTFIKVLQERKFPVSEFIPVASKRSLGKELEFNGSKSSIKSIAHAIDLRPDLAFFSAGSELSLKWAPVFAKTGCRVIDNSSAWRMKPDYKLIVPEVNGNILSKEDWIIANPNCSTIQMLVAIAPLHRKYSIKRVVVSTYQSVSGSGQKGIETLQIERQGGTSGTGIYPHPIDLNCLPHCGNFLPDGNTEEEAKLIHETHKILDPEIGVSATSVRVPVTGGHSESINLNFNKEFDLEEVRSVLRSAPGVCLVDDPASFKYPMPLDSFEKDEVFVGRLRRDASQAKSLNMWVVADNLRKGAATNAVQIGEIVAQL